MGSAIDRAGCHDGKNDVGQLVGELYGDQLESFTYLHTCEVANLSHITYVIAG